MKKIFLTIAFIATGLVASAQVGIGNTDPKTTLHVTGTNAAGTGELAAADGVTVPRVVTDMRDTGTAAAGVEVGQLVYSTNAASTGFWYWAGGTEKWNPLVAAAVQRYEDTRGGAVILTTQTAYDVTEDDFIIVTRAPGALTINLPPALANIGRLLYIVNNNTAAGNVTASGAVGATLPNALIAQNRGKAYVSDGTTWISVSFN